MANKQNAGGNMSGVGGLSTPETPEQREQRLAQERAAQGNQSAYDKMVNRTEQAKQTTPFLGQVGKEYVQTMGGTGTAISGLAQGDWGKFKEGAKEAGEGVLSAITAGPLRSLNDPPPQQFLGGSAGALQQQRDMYQSGIGQGNAIMLGGLGTSDQGVAMLGDASLMARGDRGASYNMMGAGYTIGNQGLTSQDQSLDAARAMAKQNTTSLAGLQLQQGLEQTRDSMYAQAQAARGGNQAAAMRNAHAQGAAMGLQTNQQMAMLRAQEEQARLGRMMGVEQMATQVGGQRAQLGYGMAQQGLGAAQASTGQYSGIGGQVADVGLGQANVGTASQGQYIGALNDINKAQLEADKQHASAGQASKGGIMGTVGKVIGSIF